MIMMMMLREIAVATILIASLACTIAATPRAPEMPEQHIRADSKLGMKLLSQARHLEDNVDNNENNNENNNNDENNQEDEAWQMDMTWVAGYSIMFQGCHFVQQVCCITMWHGREQLLLVIQLLY
jgi:hypothetical protein